MDDTKEQSEKEEEQSQNEEKPSGMEEQYFRDLYDRVLVKFLDKISKYSDEQKKIAVKEGIGKIINSWSSGSGLKEVDLRKWDIIGGYIYRYAPHGAGLARCRILEALNNCNDLKSILETEKKQKVISLGGGPLNDVIGFISAMSHKDFKSELDICVVDSIGQWKSVVEITKGLLEEDSNLQSNSASASKKEELDTLKHIKKVTSISFVQKSLPEELPELVEYDIVIICKLINHLQNSKLEDLVKGLYNKMKESAFIFLIDCILYTPFDSKFHCLYKSNAATYYYGTDVSEFPYFFDDHVTSKAQISVFRKISKTLDVVIEKTTEALAATSLEDPPKTKEENLKGQTSPNKKE